MKSKRILLGIIAGLVAVAALTTGAIAVTGGDSSVPAADHAPTASAAVSDALAAGIPALAQTPVSLNNSYDYGQLAHAGGNLSAARRARTTPSGGTIYWTPSSEGACLTSSPLLEAGCFSTSDLTEGVTASSILCAPALPSGTFEVYGTAPEGVDAVRIVREDGSTVAADVVGDVYVYTASTSSSRPLTVDWTQDGKTASVDASVPADFNDGGCITPKQAQSLRDAQPGSSSGEGPTTRSAQDVQRELDANR